MHLLTTLCSLIQFGSSIDSAQGVRIFHREVPYVGNNISDGLIRHVHDRKLISTLPNRVLIIEGRSTNVVVPLIQ